MSSADRVSSVPNAALPRFVSRSSVRLPSARDRVTSGSLREQNL